MPCTHYTLEKYREIEAGVSAFPGIGFLTRGFGAFVNPRLGTGLGV